MPSEREAKKERNDFVDPILKANEETTPIPNYFAPAIVLDVVQLKFIGASVLTLFALADTLYRSKGAIGGTLDTDFCYILELVSELHKFSPLSCKILLNFRVILMVCRLCQLLTRRFFDFSVFPHDLSELVDIPFHIHTIFLFNAYFFIDLEIWNETKYGVNSSFVENRHGKGRPQRRSYRSRGAGFRIIINPRKRKGSPKSFKEIEGYLKLNATVEAKRLYGRASISLLSVYSAMSPKSYDEAMRKLTEAYDAPIKLADCYLTKATDKSQSDYILA
ncbi:unnamed protein product [Lepeophtheirus salmonis]|uniref:(salmon louse) hypothetical protein n=1 Tax=Lepeophtheirus salmonis TaxID=72036 RepID=A0A817F8M3_LEPSM|nr:unnamed protein product [Lepeophtheirus salmonis]CAG9475322.1 unnamed protein product [Lepeophtheirus salmonis]